jgi:hypothetical protein
VTAPATPRYRDASLTIEESVEDLLAQMRLEERG